jgi:hypothetical protein
MFACLSHLFLYNDICCLMYVTNIIIINDDDVCEIETQDDWVVIEL